MADTKISGLTALAAADVETDADLLAIVDDSATSTKKITVDNLRTAMGPTLATEQASTSGTSIDFTSIPAWVKKIAVMFDQVSSNGTSVYLVQIGDSGGIEATTYVSGAWQGGTGDTLGTSTAGFVVVASAVGAGNNYTGTVILTRMDGDKWVSAGTLMRNDGAGQLSAGVKTLSATLDRVRITTANGTDAFDSGALNILYE